jgi:hypothetical protein
MFVHSCYQKLDVMQKYAEENVDELAEQKKNVSCPFSHSLSLSLTLSVCLYLSFTLSVCLSHSLCASLCFCALS